MALVYMRELIYIDMEKQNNQTNTSATITVGTDNKKEETKKDEPAKTEK